MNRTPSSMASVAGGPRHQQRGDISATLKNYPGAKFGSGVTQWLINHCPPHDCYLEAFVGSGALLLMKRPALSSIAIDVDARVTAAWQNHQLPELTIIEGDALKILPTLAEFHSPTTLLYADPPYLLTVRRNQRHLYRHEFSSQVEHLRLMELLLDAKCMVMVSGYDSPLYNTRLHTWRVDTFDTVTHRGQPATEVIWMNYQDTGERHDYRYVGEGFRERERIKKKINRWSRMLLAMPAPERNAILERITQLRPLSPPPSMPDVDPKKTTHRLAHSKQTPHRSTHKHEFPLSGAITLCSHTTHDDERSRASSKMARRDPPTMRGDAAGATKIQPRRGTQQTRAPHQRSLKKETK